MWVRPYPITEIGNGFHPTVGFTVVAASDFKLVISVIMSRLLMPAQDPDSSEKESGKGAETHFATVKL